MKTRIISGIVMGVIVAAVLAAGYLWSSNVIAITVALLAVGAVYELLHNAAGIKSKSALLGAGLYTVLTIFARNYCVGGFEYVMFWALPSEHPTVSSYVAGIRRGDLPLLLTVAFFIFAVGIILKKHKDFDLAKIVSFCAVPIPCAMAFFCLGQVINNQSGIYYLLLLLNFSSVCDMGAYFTGVTCGRHKLCPNISPKKTVEGAIGGIVSSIIVTIIICLCFKESVLLPIIFTVPLCILGMIGDLFASSIKRSVGLKDYGNLIPGHGGIMDRMDSIIMIAPVVYMLMTFGVI